MEEHGNFKILIESFAKYCVDDTRKANGHFYEPSLNWKCKNARKNEDKKIKMWKLQSSNLLQYCEGYNPAAACEGNMAQAAQHVELLVSVLY